MVPTVLQVEIFKMLDRSIAYIYPAYLNKLLLAICSSPDGICAFSIPHQRLGF
jgi:hypothetical protein